MIQFNLLPDIKVRYIKARRAKRMVIVSSGLAVTVSVALLVVMFSVSLFQKHHVTELNEDIKSSEKELNDTKDLAKILTIQNQLNTLPTLYTQRPVTSRLFNYVQATTPKEVSMNKLNLDFNESSLAIEVSSATLESINRFVDTLKFTTFTTTDAKEEVRLAFGNVVLDKLTRDDKLATATVKLTFDPVIFDTTKTVTLNVPQTITTRSETELPGSNSGVFDTKGSN